MNAKPFIKWAGGKGKLLPQLEAALPQRLCGFQHLTKFSQNIS